MFAMTSPCLACPKLAGAGDSSVTDARIVAVKYLLKDSSIDVFLLDEKISRLVFVIRGG
jgi:hypothetical protein